MNATVTLTKENVKLVNWPTDATHVKIQSGSKWAVASKKDISTLIGVEGVLVFGTMDKAGKVKSFLPFKTQPESAFKPSAVAQKPAQSAPVTQGATETSKSENKVVSSKNPAPNATTTTEPTAPKLGKLGGAFGYAVTAVLRALGKAGFTVGEARAALKGLKVAASDTTVQIQVNWGKNAKGGDPAPLTTAQIDEAHVAAKAEGFDPNAPVVRQSKGNRSTLTIENASLKEQVAQLREQLKRMGVEDQPAPVTA